MAPPNADRRRGRGPVWCCLLLALPLLLALGASEAHATKRVVILSISGVRGAETAQQLARNLGRQFQLVPARTFVKEAKARGLSAASTAGRTQAARALGVAGVVSGSVSKIRMRWMLRLTIYSGHNGQEVGAVSFPMRGTRLDPTTLRRVTSAVSNILARTRTGQRLEAARVRPPQLSRPPKQGSQPIEVEEVPLPAQGAAQDGAEGAAEEFDDGSVIDQSGGEGPVDDPALRFDSSALDKTKQGAKQGDALGFDVPDYSPGAGSPDGEKVPSLGQPAAAASESSGDQEAARSDRAPWESIIEADAGLLLLSRSFSFNAPVNPPNPADYTSGLVAALQLDLSAYPLALAGGGFLANLGLSLNYFRVLGLESQMSSFPQPLQTTLQLAEVGLHYRWNLAGSATSPVLKSGLGFGYMEFAIQWPTAPVPLPNVAYQYLDLAASLEWPYYRKGAFTHGAGLQFLFLYALSAGDIESADSGGYGSSLTTGLDGGASLFAAYKGLTLKLHGFYRRIGFQFDATCASLGTGCKVAGGALDIYLGGGFTVGYVY